MPPKRTKKATSTAKNPPSPPLSEKNTTTTHEPDPKRELESTDHANPPSSQQSEEITDSVPFDPDEEMPEETEHTIIEETDRQNKPSYAGGYNALKSFKGQVYSGMAVGGSHTWTYDAGTWKETKEEPDLWRIDYRTNKRRARKAPEGSGAPVGTEYHWLIVAHQHVKKVDANTYETYLKWFCKGWRTCDGIHSTGLQAGRCLDRSVSEEACLQTQLDLPFNFDLTAGSSLESPSSLAMYAWHPKAVAFSRLILTLRFCSPNRKSAIALATAPSTPST